MTATLEKTMVKMIMMAPKTKTNCLMAMSDKE